MKWKEIDSELVSQLQAEFPDGVMPNQYLAFAQRARDIYQDLYYRELDSIPDEEFYTAQVEFTHDPPE